MNFSHKGIQNRKHQLESAATHRLHKLQLMGIRLTLIGLIFISLFAGSFLIGMYTSILSSTPDVNSILAQPFCWKFPDWDVHKHLIFDTGCELYPDCSKRLYNNDCGQ